MNMGGQIVEAGALAAVGQTALIVGALLAWRFRSLTAPRWSGLIMAFGAGAILSALSTDLVAVSYAEAGAAPTALGIALGGGGFFLLITLLDRTGHRESPATPELAAQPTGEVPAATPTEGRNLLIGTVVDGLPESVAIGLTLHLGLAGVSAALVGAVFIAGLPQAIGVAAALLAGGMVLWRIIARFLIVVAAGALAGVIGYQVLYEAPITVIAIIQSIAAGAMIVVVVNEMVPIAVRGARRWAGPTAMGGFVFAAVATWISV